MVIPTRAEAGRAGVLDLCGDDVSLLLPLRNVCRRSGFIDGSGELNEL